MQQITFRAMGSQIQIVADAPVSEQALGRAAGWFERWERALSRFRPGSELSRLNRRSGAEVAVSPLLGQVLGAAIHATRASDGLVTPTLLAQLEAAGYTRDFSAGPDDSAESQAAPQPAAPALRYDALRRVVRAAPGVRIDLGGVAKGWAADQAARQLRACAPVLVDAGGDIAISGPRQGGAPWAVGVADPHNPEALIEVLLVPAGGVATSGRDYRRWLRGGREQHHIIDPRTGRPAETDVLSATVVGPSALAAEVAAKAALILGGEQGMAWLAERPELAGLLALEDGRVLCTPTLARYRAQGASNE